MLDAVAVGSSLIDIFLTLHDANAHCKLHAQEGEFCLKYGEKIPIDASEFHMGGNASNVSVGLRRLGFKSGVVVEIGTDDFGRRIVKGFKDEKVNTGYLKQTKGPSAFGIAISFKGERTLLGQHILRKHDYNLKRLSAKWVYLTSIGREWKSAYRNVYEQIKEKKIKLAFNPGTLQLESGHEGYGYVLKIADILILNKEEAERVTGSKGQEIKSLLGKLVELGPKIVVITDGNKGSFVMNADGRMYHFGIIPAEIVEKTGAGDAYSSGFLSSIIYGFDIPTAMKWGSVNAASVIGKIGAEPGLLTKSEMEKKLKSIDMQAKEI